MTKTKDRKEPKIRLEQRRVTVAQASRWLEDRRANRTISEDTVTRYLRDMQEGQWNDGEADLNFDADGRLIDGQHKLLALIQYGKPITFCLKWGCSDSHYMKVDTGRVRTLCDLLEIWYSMRHGEDERMRNSATVAGAVEVLMIHMMNPLEMQRNGRNKVSPARKVEFFERHFADGSLEHHVAKCRRYKTDFAGWVSCSHVAAISWLFAQVNEDDSDYYVETLAKGGSGLGPGDPIYVLREQLLKHARKPHMANIQGRQLWCYMIKCWNAIQEGREIRQAYKWRVGGQKPESFPLISGFPGWPEWDEVDDLSELKSGGLSAVA